jgi:hypothetical protein
MRTIASHAITSIFALVRLLHNTAMIDAESLSIWQAMIDAALQEGDKHGI